MVKPFDDFRQRVRNHQENIETAQSSMEYAYMLIRKEKHIGPGQCARITKSIDIAGEPIREFCELMSTPELLPQPVRPLRHSLLIILQNAKELISDLISSISSYYIICRTYSDYEISVYREEILGQLEALVQSKDNIAHHIDVLLLKSNPGAAEAATSERQLISFSNISKVIPFSRSRARNTADT